MDLHQRAPCVSLPNNHLSAAPCLLRASQRPFAAHVTQSTRRSHKHVSHAQPVQWVQSAGAVAAPTQAVKQSAAAAVAAPAQAASSGCLVRSRVVKNRKGLFRIRHLQESDLLHVADLQASCFHEALPVKPLDQLAFTMFKAEVLSAVQKKTKVLADDGFTILVVESCSSGGSATSLGHSSSSSSNSNSSDWDAAVWFGDQQAVAGRHHSSTAAWEADDMSTASSTADTGKIVGVIEVGVQDEQDVLQHLPRATETYAYVSSMAVAPHLRRCGVGAALLQAAEQQAVLWDQDLVALHVYETNQPAIQLYQSHGLSSHAADPTWRKYIGGKVRQLMVKWL